MYCGCKMNWTAAFWGLPYVVSLQHQSKPLIATVSLLMQTGDSLTDVLRAVSVLWYKMNWAAAFWGLPYVAIVSPVCLQPR